MLKKIINKSSFYASRIKSIYINFKYLPFKEAKRLPILVHWSSNIKLTNSRILFDEAPQRFIVRFGIDKSPDVPENRKSLILLENSLMTLSGNYPTLIRKGGIISCQNSKLKIGGNFFANSNLFLKAQKEIVIGNGVMLGYNVSFRDSDGHVFNQIKNASEKIIIEDNVWINAKSDILKGVKIKSGSVVAYSALVTSSINDKHSENSLIAGFPAKCVKEDISWSGLEDFFGENYLKVESSEDDE